MRCRSMAFATSTRRARHTACGRRSSRRPRRTDDFAAGQSADLAAAVTAAVSDVSAASSAWRSRRRKPALDDAVQLIDVAHVDVRQSVVERLALEVPAVERKRHLRAGVDDGAVPRERTLHAAAGCEGVSGARLVQGVSPAIERERQHALDQNDGNLPGLYEQIDDGAANAEIAHRRLDRVAARFLRAGDETERALRRVEHDAARA